ncbi:hypothetical protein [Peristeroidobacter soli]|uniref:hypothetical protein n=1 Tax=Peristeroidobacter soli TaxID=2497877 RepID=UPI00101D50A0|nr:hypothetical protein [Peristeroidobacter soli]
MGTLLHQSFPKMHLALIVTLGILTGIVLFVPVLKFAMIFWLWTATLPGGIGYSILRDVQDKGWAMFWAAVTVLLIVGLRLNSRNPPADRAEFLVEDSDPSSP